MGEDLRSSRTPFEPLDCGNELRLRVHPSHLDACWRLGQNAIGFVGDTGQDNPGRSGGHRFDGGTHGGDRRVVSDEQVPVGLGGGGVLSARSGEDECVSGLRVLRPGSGDPVIVVDDEVDAQPFLVQVDLPHRVGAAARQLFGGLFAQFRQVIGWDELMRGISEEEFDVLVGRVVRVDVVEGVAPEADPHQMRADLGRLEDGEHRLLAGGSCSALGGVGCGRHRRPFSNGAPLQAHGRLRCAEPPRRRDSVRLTLSNPCRPPTAAVSESGRPSPGDDHRGCA